MINIDAILSNADWPKRTDDTIAGIRGGADKGDAIASGTQADNVADAFRIALMQLDVEHGKDGKNGKNE